MCLQLLDEYLPVKLSVLQMIAEIRVDLSGN